MTATVDILIPTCNRLAGLAVTLTSLIAQTFREFRVIISDQTEEGDPLYAGEVQAVLRVLRSHGHAIELHKHLPRRGMAEHRQFLLDQVTAPYALFLDDDVILEATALHHLVTTLQTQGCGFVGSALHGLSFIHDVRPQEQAIEFWQGAVEPEAIKPDTSAWERWRLHNAANLYHLQQRLDLAGDKPHPYKIAWIGGCILYDTAKLRSIGGFSFWRDLPAEHCGEDVLVQQQLMARYGGCGIIPSGAYHQELPTTIRDRRVAANNIIDWSTDQPLQNVLKT